jgi:hypothetical protein
LSLDGCRSNCEQDSACKSFAWSARYEGCHLKDKRVEKGNTSTQQKLDYNTYYVDACGLSPPTCLYHLGGVAVDEGEELADFPETSLDKCRAHCERNSACRSFAWSAQFDACHLKNKMVMKGSTPVHHVLDYKTYYVAECGNQTCFVGLGGVAQDEGESLEDSSGSLEQCKERCSADIRCQSFAYSQHHSTCHTKTRVVTPGTPTVSNGDYQTYYRHTTQGECPDDEDPISGGAFKHQVTFGSLRSSYDYVVVGGGAAGCAAAWTLAHENPSKNVLLIEAGPREPLDFNEGFAEASKDHDIWTTKPNGWRISSLLGGGTVRNGRSFRGVPRWYILDHMSHVDSLAFEESALWAADTFAAPKRWPEMQSSVLIETMKSVPEINVPSENPDDFEELGGYAARHFRGMNGLVSSTDVPGYAYYTAYATVEDGKRTSGQRVIEEYHGKILMFLWTRWSTRLCSEMGEELSG